MSIFIYIKTFAIWYALQFCCILEKKSTRAFHVASNEATQYELSLSAKFAVRAGPANAAPPTATSWSKLYGLGCTAQTRPERTCALATQAGTNCHPPLTQIASRHYNAAKQYETISITQLARAERLAGSMITRFA